MGCGEQIVVDLLHPKTMMLNYFFLFLQTLLRVSNCVAANTFQEKVYCHRMDAGAAFIVSSHHFNINQSNKLVVVSLRICNISKFYSVLFFYSFFISHELTEIKSRSPRVVVQQIKTNVSAFCSRSQHILTRRSHYITR